MCQVRIYLREVDNTYVHVNQQYLTEIYSESSCFKKQNKKTHLVSVHLCWLANKLWLKQNIPGVVHQVWLWIFDLFKLRWFKLNYLFSVTYMSYVAGTPNQCWTKTETTHLFWLIVLIFMILFSWKCQHFCSLAFMTQVYSISVKGRPLHCVCTTLHLSSGAADTWFDYSNWLWKAVLL